MSKSALKRSLEVCKRNIEDGYERVVEANAHHSIIPQDVVNEILDNIGSKSLSNINRLLARVEQTEIILTELRQLVTQFKKHAELSQKMERQHEPLSLRRQQQQRRDNEARISRSDVTKGQYLKERYRKEHQEEDMDTDEQPTHD